MRNLVRALTILMLTSHVSTAAPRLLEHRDLFQMHWANSLDIRHDDEGFVVAFDAGAFEAFARRAGV